jgi:hypothetical protein
MVEIRTCYYRLPQRGRAITGCQLLLSPCRAARRAASVGLSEEAQAEEVLKCTHDLQPPAPPTPGTTCATSNASPPQLTTWPPSCASWILSACRVRGCKSIYWGTRQCRRMARCNGSTRPYRGFEPAQRTARPANYFSMAFCSTTTVSRISERLASALERKASFQHPEGSPKTIYRSNSDGKSRIRMSIRATTTTSMQLIQI